MTDFLQRLKQRKLVQRAIACATGAWAVMPVLDPTGGEFGWPGAMMRVVMAMSCVGLVVALRCWTDPVGER